MSVLTKLGALAILASSLAVDAAHAQSATANSVPGVIAICAPVIDAEYEGDLSPWGECVTAVGAFLDGVPAGGSEVVDLVAALTELYRSDATCRIAETELPLAIARAADFADANTDQRARILLISDTVEECDEVVTAAFRTVDPQGSAF